MGDLRNRLRARTFWMLMKMLLVVTAFVLAGCGGAPSATGSTTPTSTTSAVPSVHATVSAGSFRSALDAAVDDINRYAAQRTAGSGTSYTPGSCQPTPQQACLTGGQVTNGVHAAFARFEWAGTGGGALCYVYVYENSAGWHAMNAICTQNSGYSPIPGPDNIVTVPGACANVRDAPGLSGKALACLRDATSIELDGGPVYVDEGGQAGTVANGRIWWHVKGKGWIAHELIDNYRDSYVG